MRKKGGWTREWPTAPGTYWFWGWDLGRVDPLGKKNRPEYHLVKVWKTMNSVAHIADGRFWYREEAVDGWWRPAVLPDPPEDGLG